MSSDPYDSPFVGHLRAEKLQAQATRGRYTGQKLAYATALLGLGALGIETTALDFSLVLYLVPVVAITFDLYILAEDYSVKRIGAYLRTHSHDPLERAWEAWVSRNRDTFALWAMPLLSTLLLVGAALVVLLAAPPVDAWQWVAGLWGAICLAAIWLLFRHYRRKRDTITVDGVTPLEASSDGA
jgi:cell division protein FtsW (lipid II flippase)